MTRTTTRLVSTLAVSFALLAVGCSSSQNAENGADDGAGTGSAQSSGARSTSGGEDLAAGSCQVESVYFAYDSSDLDGRARSTLERNATCINQRRASAQVTGMTDPRGTEEYNLALGDRRARTVSGYMSNLGVEGGRVANRSMGEEMASGENESGWATDRRAQIDPR